MKYAISAGAYKGKNVIELLEKVAEHGFHGLEYLSWKSVQDVRELVKAQERLGVGISAVCTTFFNLVDGSKSEQYLDGLRHTLAFCKEAGTPSIITQTGQEMPGISREKQKNDMMETLKRCAVLCEEAGVVLELEPLNGLVNHPGHFLQYSDESAEVIDRVGSPFIKLVFDVYHQQITEGNVIRNAVAYIDRIHHFHIADNPGRKQPGTGELNYLNILKAIKQTGFDGFVALECGYTIDTDEALHQFKRDIVRHVEQ
ncbi:TIM barrel protein [Paenibacillus mesophilus]|uniref:TIM barrel protein n=1 Tax=Paenibacillus mesophilus TaxID=2582849 RepID=UPI00110EDC12|nr:TIM barrel protein [Paenibacillus mesophilus]TMV52315.1 TIM barrel protein [Paenibacillus mesophilus]